MAIDEAAARGAVVEMAPLWADLDAALAAPALHAAQR
jgi:hypothetical protein